MLMIIMIVNMLMINDYHDCQHAHDHHYCQHANDHHDCQHAHDHHDCQLAHDHHDRQHAHDHHDCQHAHDHHDRQHARDGLQHVQSLQQPPTIISCYFSSLLNVLPINCHTMSTSSKGTVS